MSMNKHCIGEQYLGSVHTTRGVMNASSVDRQLLTRTCLHVLRASIDLSLIRQSRANAKRQQLLPFKVTEGQ